MLSAERMGWKNCPKQGSCQSSPRNGIRIAPLRAGISGEVSKDQRLCDLVPVAGKTLVIIRKANRAATVRERLATTLTNWLRQATRCAFWEMLMVIPATVLRASERQLPTEE